MFIRGLKGSLVVVLLLVLVGGTVYILARPTEARGGRAFETATSYGDSTGGAGAVLRGQGNGVTTQESHQDDATEPSGLARGAGSVGQGMQEHSEWEYAVGPEWQTVQGSVVEAGSEILVATDGGEVLIGMGQAFYREEQGFEVAVGDEVRVQGYYEDGEFKAGSVENLTTGVEIVLRDASGRPMWSGRGNNKNRS